MSDSTATKMSENLEESSPEYHQDPKNIAVEGIAEKSELHLDDETAELAVQALRTDEADPVVAKRVLRKIDLYILPFMCITYGMDYFSFPLSQDLPTISG